ncbi:MAG: hypothetical protein AAGK32_16255, partial [Actinomycetota bacterium]
MPTISTTHLIDPTVPAGADLLRRLETARDDVVGERPLGDGRFALAAGPFEHYDRSLTRAVGSAPGTIEVTETIRFRLAVPVWRVAFNPLARRALRSTERRPGSSPWWSPPDRFEPRA